MRKNLNERKDLTLSKLSLGNVSDVFRRLMGGGAKDRESQRKRRTNETKALNLF